MKTPPLLFSLPMLITSLSAHSLPADTVALPAGSRYISAKTTAEDSSRETAGSTITDLSRPLSGPGGKEMWPTAEGVMMRLPLRGKMRLMQVMTNQFLITEANGKQRVARLATTESLDGITREMTRAALTGGAGTDLMVSDPDFSQNEGGKMLITPRVVVVLAEGTSFSAFANDSGAIGAMRPGWAPECLILNYATAMDAIGAAEELSRKPGVVHVEHVAAVRRTPEFIPTEQYFSGGGPSYQPPCLTDNVDTYVLVPFGTSAYQWWANNRATPLGPVNSVPAILSLGDYPPIEYNPALPRVHGEQADLRLPVAWENPPSLSSACPRDRKSVV